MALKELSDKVQFEFKKRNLAIVFVDIFYFLNAFIMVLSNKCKTVFYTIQQSFL